MASRLYTTEQMGDAGEMLVAAELTLHGIPSFNGAHAKFVAIYLNVDASCIGIACVPNEFRERWNGLSGSQLANMVVFDFYLKVRFRHARSHLSVSIGPQLLTRTIGRPLCAACPCIPAKVISLPYVRPPFAAGGFGGSPHFFNSSCSSSHASSDLAQLSTRRSSSSLACNARCPGDSIAE